MPAPKKLSSSAPLFLRASSFSSGGATSGGGNGRGGDKSTGGRAGPSSGSAGLGLNSPASGAASGCALGPSVQSSGPGPFAAALMLAAWLAARARARRLDDCLSPRGGRPMPQDARVNDLFYWQVRVTARDTDAVGTAASMSG